MTTTATISPVIRNVLSVAKIPPMAVNASQMARITPRIVHIIRPRLAVTCPASPAPAQLAAWCGLAPGNRESAGKRMRAGTRKGNKHLKAAMTESAWATARTRTRPRARFRRLARRFGKGNEKKPRSRSPAPCCASPGW
jgi:transposase